MARRRNSATSSRLKLEEAQYYASDLAAGHGRRISW